MLPYLVGQPLRLQDFDVRDSGEMRCSLFIDNIREAGECESVTRN